MKKNPMKIELHEITVRELVKGYKDDGDRGVTGYGGKLDIRPPYQREFVYKDKQRDAVIETLRKDFPLNVMYWAVRDDGTYEVLDGQQRTISICQYVTSKFSVEGLGFHNLQADQQKQIRDYKLHVYHCEGTPSEKLDWFRIVNIAGMELEPQELRNAVYAGSWLEDAKRHFSRQNGPAHGLAGKYLKCRAIRQEYLETAIKWKKGAKQSIEEYMGEHQHDPTAKALWSHFKKVINRVEAVFPNYRKPMAGVDWGGLYERLKDQSLDPKHLETEVDRLMIDDDVTKKAGIFPYLLTGEEKHLSIRAFTDAMRQSAYARQKGICKKCKKKLELAGMEADHITPWSKGGKTVARNCQMLCKPCNRRKSNK